MTMRELLRTMPAGVPDDSLHARICGRQSFLIKDWERLLLHRQPLSLLAAAPWRISATDAVELLQSLQREYFWTFLRMDEELRCRLAPLFWLAELPTLATALRLQSGGAAYPEALLQDSLLANPIKKILRHFDGSSATVALLTEHFISFDHRFSDCHEIYQNGGSGALEASLYDHSLLHALTNPLYSELRSWLVLLIDSRNLTALAKYLRWRLITPPRLLEGGTLALTRLKGIFLRREAGRIIELAMQLGGLTTSNQGSDLEQILHAAQERVLRRLARKGDVIWTILYYLWRCHNEAINLALLNRLEALGSDAVSAELWR